MSDVAKCLLRICYYYALFIGVLNFEIDLRTGRARITRRTSIYAAFVNMFSLCCLPWLGGMNVLHAFWSQAELLHDYMFLVMICGRVLCVCVTLLTHWPQRRRFVRLVNALQRLTQQRPRVTRMWRRGVISKFVSGFLTDLLQTLTCLLLLWDKLTIELTLSICVFFTLSALVNIIISHYYFAVLNVYGHYTLLNRELRNVLAELRTLESEHRTGVFALKCCALADRLEAIARTQFQLQALMQQLKSCFGLQSLFIHISYYMTAVAMIYFLFCELTGAIRLNLSNRSLALLSCNFVCYFADIHISVNIIFSLLDTHAEMRKLLAQHTLLAQGLDERLEVVFESFQLQLAWNPLKLSVLGLYNVDKSRAVTMASSVVTSSLVVIQHDLKNVYLY